MDFEGSPREVVQTSRHQPGDHGHIPGPLQRAPAFGAAGVHIRNALSLDFVEPGWGGMGWGGVGWVGGWGGWGGWGEGGVG